MLWSEQTNHVNDCYFCAAEVRGLDRRNRDTWKYPVVESARLPRPHSDAVPVPVYREPGADFVEQLPAGRESTSESEESDQPEEFSPSKFDQKELNDLVRDPRLPKDAAELLASRLREKNLLASGTKRKMN